MAATTAGAGTPERAPALPTRRFAQVSVRTRITAVISLLTLAAMTVAGVLVYTLESARIDTGVAEQVKQETDEFRRFERTGIDPDTGSRFTDAFHLVRTFLARNVPDDDELLVAYQGQDARNISPNRYGEEFLDDPDYLRVIEPLLASGGTVEIADGVYGEVWVTAVPVRSRSSDASLVIVNFLDDEHVELRSTLRTYSIVAVLSLGLITLIAARTSGRLLAPLRTVRDTARHISTTDLSRRIPETGNDDITALTRTFNEMLARLEDGVEGQRRFLDDAGHELRTPLTVLRGHLELLESDNPADVERTRALLIDEVDRMNRLVGDLILLAKSRRPDFVQPHPVELHDLTASLLEKARGLGERDWVLDARLLESRGAAWVHVDEQRITQALLQLADNAVKHTDIGTRIEIGSECRANTVRLWVEDAGAGVRPEDRQRIFERFGRGVVRAGDEGFGLGLSIVKAIVDAHGGQIAVSDAEPHGARFEIVLPRSTARDQDPRGTI